MINILDGVLAIVEKRLLQVLFMLMTVITLVQVFNRILFNYPMPWSDEFARYLFVWVVYLASSYAVREKAHIGVTALIDRLSYKTRRITGLFTDAVCFVFSTGLFIFTVQIIRMQISMGQASPSMRLPMQYAYAGLAVGGLFMAIRFVIHIYRLIVTPRQTGEGSV